MKTPDEIKKGLECCTPVWKGNHWKTCDEECPYAAEMVNCRTMLNHDAIALIQQQGRAIENMAEVNAGLSRKRDAMKNHIQQLEADNAQQARCIENLTDKMNALNDELAELQAERDAAVADLEHVKDCDSCKYDNACFTGKKDCFCCHEKRCPCLTCQYEWRGVQKEDSDVVSS